MAKPATLRKLLRTFGDIKMWWVEDGRIPEETWPPIRYVVSTGDNEKTFDRPYEAWAYFRQLANAENEDTR